MKAKHTMLLLLAILLIMAVPALANNSNVPSNVADSSNVPINVPSKVTDSSNMSSNVPSNVAVSGNVPVNAKSNDTSTSVTEIKGVSILLDGKVIDTNPVSYIDTKSGQTLVPIRFVSESLGAEVKWEQATKKITIIQGDKNIVMNLDTTAVYINDDKKTLDQGVTPKLVNASTMVPLRFLSETFGYEVGFDTNKTMPTIVTKVKKEEVKEEPKEEAKVEAKEEPKEEVKEDPIPASRPSAPPVNKAPYVLLSNDLSKTVIEESSKHDGTPYVWGGDNPSSGFDCSGLVQWTYKKAGINLPRTATAQWLATQEVPKDKAQPGDLIFFRGTYGDDKDRISHVGIYIDESRMHNSNNSGVCYSNWSNSYWQKHFDSIRRVKQ